MKNLDKKVVLPRKLVDRVLEGDCLANMKFIPDATIDFIVTSPPYANNRRRTYKGVPVEEYVNWFKPISLEMMRVLKPNGSLILNLKERTVNGERGIYVYQLVLAMREQGWLWIDDYIWHKKNSYPGKWPNRFRDAWEHCFHFTRSKKFKMYQGQVMVPRGRWAEKRLLYLSESDKKRNGNKTMSGFGRRVANWIDRKKVYPTNVLHLATESKNRNHSATFPVELPSWFIKLFTRQNQIVFDPFLGSGTTAVAALRLDRHFLGVELNRKYCRLARSRIKLARGQMKLEPAKNGIHRHHK